ncbi:hypothetical protein [Nodosilinea sp. LEGE 07088]|nr:hypothetical protein [Nodosilinea sp. LEGE 07088]
MSESAAEILKRLKPRRRRVTVIGTRARATKTKTPAKPKADA